MERFWDLAELVAILLTILVGVFFVVSAFSKNPGEIMKSFGRALGWIAGVFMLAIGICGGAYVAMPVDFLPEAVLPVIGLIDDLIVVPISLCTGTTGLITLTALGVSSAQRRKAQLPAPKDDEKKLLNG